MKEYKFSVMIALTYWDTDIEVSVELSDDEVSRIKALVSQADNLEGGLLHLLEENDDELFEKFWNDTIFPCAFVEILCDGKSNGYVEVHEDDNFRDWRKAPFDDLYELYGDGLELEHSSCCFCEIPDWAKE